MFINATQASTDEQVFLLMKQYALKQGDAMLEVAKVGLQKALHVVDLLPAGELKKLAAEGTTGADAKLELAGTGLKDLIEGVYSHNGTRFCKTVKPFWQNVTKLDHELHTNMLPSFNQTASQVSQIKPLIQSFAPNVADKLMALADKGVDDAYTMLSSMDELLHRSTDVFAGVLEKNLGCSVTSASFRFGPGFAAVIASLSASLWIAAQ
mmetsp:Transcript_16738/g.51717  ORF Transcript_16738/g.51717 Transcript_16738/m.51717 type:complete len:209 (+) Transcript_16738:472-1098(+)